MQEIAKNQMHTMFKVQEQQGKLMLRLHCNVVAGCDRLNARKVAPRMNQCKEEKNAGTARRLIDSSTKVDTH